MKKTILIKDIDSMYFAGPSDKNIKFIEKKFNSSIVLRGNELVVNGEKNEVQKLEQLVHAIINTILRKNHISITDIQLLLNSNNGSSSNTYDQLDSDNIVLYTHKDPVYAKTKGQKKYHESILNNDILIK